MKKRVLFVPNVQHAFHMFITHITIHIIRTNQIKEWYEESERIEQRESDGVADEKGHLCVYTHI